MSSILNPLLRAPEDRALEFVSLYRSWPDILAKGNNSFLGGGGREEGGLLKILFMATLRFKDEPIAPRV